MVYGKFWKGIDLRHPRLVRKANPWLNYVAWWLVFNLEQMPPLLPDSLYRALAPKWAHRLHRLYLGTRRPFGRLAGWLRPPRGKWCHRADFTDPDSGLLYGGPGDCTEYIEGCFERMIARIDSGDELLTLTANGKVH